ncbi:MAG: fibro-slime domain-containing protein [Planctomycetota bacterium]|jgi:fibro-slime domain-containing protein
MSSNQKAATFLIAAVLGMGLCVAMFLPATRPQTMATTPAVKTMLVPAVVRDFRAAHPDFGVLPDDGRGHYASMVPERLPAPGAPPTFTGSGHKVLRSATDAQGRTIAPHLASRESDDRAATLDTRASTVGVTSETTFAEWFSDVPGTNVSAPIDLPFVQQRDDTFVFDRDSFRPVDDRLFGNEGAEHNLYFTVQFRARFTHEPGLFFNYVGTHEAWVYVGDRLGIDAGGIHGTLDQRLDLDRLELQPGARYWLTFNLAHRHGPASDLRMETNIEFEGTGRSTRTDP